MFNIKEIAAPRLGLSGLEPTLSDEERALQSAANRFALETMRPYAATLDRLTAEEVVAAGSPLFEYLQKFQASGLFNLDLLASLQPEQMARLLPLLLEELGYGDVGLTVLAIATSFPSFAAALSGDPELLERFKGLPGCWIATQPDRGSDVLDMAGRETLRGSRQDRGNLVARVDGDHVVINGQTSEWVSAGPIAQCALAYLQCDYGQGIHRANGSLRLIGILIPFDIPGVSKGKAHDKLGQRSMPQGAIYFDNVRVPRKYILAGEDAADLSFYGALTFANMEIACTLGGLARASFEHALKYVHERRQGGAVLMDHQSVRLRVFDAWRKLEACKAMARRVVDYNYGKNGPHFLASVTSKTFVTQSAYEVADAAVQLMGANGLSREYPVEKLLRDARAALIEDGENNVLSLHGANHLSDWYRQHVG
ncbi:acyl-CoA dehydrogenase [Povalibacter sp.]|uniref:acyl-CoA dehydrogenase family protein n=1 Tax=Povalibacter sp. TaxID=1962978 RepID=UPI002F413C6B